MDNDILATPMDGVAGVPEVNEYQAENAEGVVPSVSNTLNS
jgi:hypothetical protein